MLNRNDQIQELRTRFINKTFISSVGDARMFCIDHSIDHNVSSRTSAKSRIFHYIVNEMNDTELQAIIDNESYSGPSRLAPIADAIRRNGRANK